MRRYDTQTKIETVTLAKEIGVYKASQELGIPEGTIRTWLDKEKAGSCRAVQAAARGR